MPREEVYDQDNDEEEIPKSSFTTYVAEGDALFKNKEYYKALQSYSTALELQTDSYCLVSRSKCYLQIGDTDSALRDAEAALAEDSNFSKGLHAKAEALYAMGDFEYALVHYHRGHKLRPELNEFRLGIQKAKEAIDNSIGSPSRVKLETKGDLSFFNKQDESVTKSKVSLIAITSVSIKKSTKPVESSDKTIKQLLGELYEDKLYLEKLLSNGDFVHGKHDQAIYQCIQEGLGYLDSRTEFWRQQKPLYARKKQKKANKDRRSKSPTHQSNMTKYIVHTLEEIDAALAEGRPDDGLKKAQSCLRTVESLDIEDVPNKMEVIANLHSCIGNAMFDQGNMDGALVHHRKDLEIGKKNEIQEAIGRALDNMGRVYARKGEFAKAIDFWEEKLPMKQTPLESTWLYHEIGRCHLELEHYVEARRYGEKSLANAEEAQDNEWQLNACVLIAQANVKLSNIADAVEMFERGLEIAKVIGDKKAEKGIQRALEDTSAKLIANMKNNRRGSESDSRPTTTEQEAQDDYERDAEEVADEVQSETNKDDDASKYEESVKEDDNDEGNDVDNTNTEEDDRNGRNDAKAQDEAAEEVPEED
ncbi:uncharacterized protein TRIADDRAFT_30804 [Trichoplax adhaerens]|uniref:Outer dynein arm-docking complex subunit 4 n=1 Tax=Trichoplax adhaerens TaxID=10228 RepID=B3S849_TRIAD|nr:hypothetical protein TRIADDRAFT_30804 [Trichoplax adhaerens]EDV21041.1 hypothetical protein TRIADDRAFT_30804 [Trichoplax adhaerens]|eukprot:XP_002116371.1 hypothetical protein TRIADDRAFT_30804 [Trichoplax adhaerens]